MSFEEDLLSRLKVVEERVIEIGEHEIAKLVGELAGIMKDAFSLTTHTPPSEPPAPG